MTFDIPHVGNDPAPNWYSDDDFQRTMHAILSSTEDPSIFQMSFDKEPDVSGPGEIELSLGEGSIPLEDLDFSTYDLQQYLQSSPEFAVPVPPHSLPDAQASLSQAVDESLAAAQQGLNYNADDYINYDAEPAGSRPLSPGSSSHPSPSYPPEDAAEPLPNPYTPPAGAVNSSNRRVGASWRPPYHVTDAGIDSGPPRQWSVRAT